MFYRLSMACGCVRGRRGNNEDNFYFNGTILPSENDGINGILALSAVTAAPIAVLVFDGMGGENYGEVAACAAASALVGIGIPALTDKPKHDERSLYHLALFLNYTVVEKAKAVGESRMGSTLSGLFFSQRYAYMCNLGDSPVFRLRKNKIAQISTSDVEAHPQDSHRKPGLTQHLGIDPEFLQIKPHTAAFRLRKGDMFLICSDGVTDALSPEQILSIVTEKKELSSRVDTLIKVAGLSGSLDNITAILVSVSGGTSFRPARH